LIEDLKKIRANISIFEFLKFPLILHKMLQNIEENNKNNDLSIKKTAEISSKQAKMIPTKTTSKPLDKRDLTKRLYQI
jgi:hypothetical protein